MKTSEKIVLAIALVAIAMPILAWINPSVDYEARFYWGIVAICLLLVAGGILVTAGRSSRKKQKTLDDLSGEISWAIHNIVNMPKESNETWDHYAARFRSSMDNWCAKVDKMLEDRTFFTQSDLLHFQRLGIITQIAMVGHPAVDHAFSMMNLKLERLRQVIVLVQQRS